jgi:hypothetical protein
METVFAASAPAGSKGKGLARASWVTFLAVVVGNGVLAAKFPIVTDLLALAGAVIGVTLGAMALSRMGREGRKGILGPAVAGVLLNGLLLFIWVTNFLAYRARHG